MTVPRALGAYGMRLPDLPGDHWLTPVPDDWPDWHFEYVPTAATQPNPGMWLEGDQIRLPLLDLGSISIDRHARVSRVHAALAPAPQAWVHPYLSPTAIFAADWQGRLGFHSSAFLDASGRVWGLLGDRGQGKSTTVAWLAARERTVFSDDLLITDGASAFAGPRCIDLREGAASFFGIGTPLGVVGARERWRVDLPALSSAVAPLGGFIDLAWSDGPTTVTPIVATDKADYLTRARALLVGQQHALPWLRTLGVPMFTVARRQQWSAQESALATMLDVVDNVDPGAGAA